MGNIGPDLWDLDGLASYSGGFYPEKKMRFSIVTPSFKQLDYLECCIASVADQGTGNGGRRTGDGGQGGSENVGMCESGKVRRWEGKNVRR